MNDLPRTCVPTPKIEEDCYDWYKRHESRLALVGKNSYDLVFIGDSITHFWEGEPGAAEHGTKVWKEVFSNRRVLNLGYGFDRTQNVLWRLEHGELDGQNPRAIVLNIGTNQFSITPKYSGDTAEIAAEGVLAVVRKLRTMLPSTEIVVMAVFPRGGLHAGYREKINGLNSCVKKALGAIPGTTFLDISKQMLHPDGECRTELFQGDCCHLADGGYRIWAEALRPLLDRIPVVS